MRSRAACFSLALPLCGFFSPLFVQAQQSPPANQNPPASPERQTGMYSSEDFVGQASIVRWGEDGGGSRKFFFKGKVIKILASNGLIVSASMEDTGWKMRSDIMVTNETGERIDVIPGRFTLDVVVPNPKSLAYEDPDKLAKSISRRAMWANALSGFAAGVQETQSTTTTNESGTVSVTDIYGNTVSGDYSGTGTSTTTAPDYAAQQRALEEARTRNQEARGAIDYLNRIALRANTVMPRQNVFGAVFFKREKKCKEVLLCVPIGNTIFEFPFVWVKR